MTQLIEPVIVARPASNTSTGIRVLLHQAVYAQPIQVEICLPLGPSDERRLLRTLKKTPGVEKVASKSCGIIHSEPILCTITFRCNMITLGRVEQLL